MQSIVRAYSVASDYKVKCTKTYDLRIKDFRREKKLKSFVNPKQFGNMIT